MLSQQPLAGQEDPRKTTYAVVKAKCPEFKSGCPYTKVVPQLKGLQGNCPSFKQGCPFKDLDGKAVEDTLKKLNEMKAKCPAKDAHGKALKAIMDFSVKEEKAKGKCPFFNNACLFSAALTFEDMKVRCPSFKGACPYQDLVTPEFKALAKGCPEFRNGCPFQKCQSVQEILDKMLEMKAKCKGKANHTKALQAFAALSVKKEESIGKCPFFSHGCIFKGFV